ncbi:MAG: FAD binding domain-containing protein [Candidatus Limnocylindrales bacterium]
MIPAAFDYVRPASTTEALRLIASDEGARVLAGGQSLLPLLKLRLGSVERLIDIGRLDDLRGVRDAGAGTTEIGALTTYREVLGAPLIRARHPFLLDAIERIGDRQVRNRGTVGGAIAHGDPAADLPALLLALDAQIELRSATATRSVPAAAFFEAPFTTAARHDELITTIRLPAPPSDGGGAYRLLEQPASGYAIVGVAAVVAKSAGRVRHVRVGVTGAGEVAYRAMGVEGALHGSDGSAAAVAAAAAHAVEGIAVKSDFHADAAYRTAMALVLARRALDAAIGR